MNTPRFFCPVPLSLDSAPVKLPTSVANHVGRSLRMRTGDEIILFNSKGGEFSATLLFEEGTALAKLLRYNEINRLPKGRINLAQALPAGDKMDWIIEKNSELGISKIIPIKAARSILQLDEKRLSKRILRWHNISIASAEQCGRNIPLDIQSPTRLDNFLNKLNDDLLIVCHPEATHPMTVLIQQILAKKPSLSSVCLLIGPEGGWSDDEINLMRKYSQEVYWGERILRTETAGLVLASSVMTLLNW